MALRDGDGNRLGATRVTGTTHDITGLTPDTDYRVFVRTIGDGFVKSNIVQFKTKVAPSSSINTIPDITMDETEKKTIPLSVTPASDSVTYAITKQDGTAAPSFVFIAPISSDGAITDHIVLLPARTDSGQYSLRVTATIGSDTIHEDFVLTVNDDNIDPPIISKRTANSITIEVPGTEPTNDKDSPLCVVADVFESSPWKLIWTESLTIHGNMTITNLLPNTDYTISVVNECKALSLATFNVNTNPLRFTNTIPDITMDEGTSRQIKLNATDYNDRAITYNVEVLNDKTLPGSEGTSNGYLVLEPDRTAAGEYTLRVTATAGSDIIRDEFVLTVSDPGIDPPQIKTQNSTSVTIEVASEDYNPQDATCTTAGIFETSSGFLGAEIEDFESNPLTITGLTPDTAYTINVYKYCDPTGLLGTLKFTTSSSSSEDQTSPDNSQTSPDNSQTSPDNSQTSPDNSQTLVLSRTISGNDVTLSWNDLADTIYIVAVFDGDGDRVIEGGAARVSPNSYTLNDLDADTYTAFVRTPGPSGTHTMSNTVTFTITS